MQWHVIYTKPRWEKKVCEALLKQNIRAYCPLITEYRQWSYRKKKITTPLFKSYVFVRISEKDRAQVFEVPGVIQYLFWLGKPAIVQDKEIKIIQTWLEDKAVKAVDIQNLTPGEKIAISKGRFKGKEAVLSEVGTTRLRLILDQAGIVLNLKISEVLDNIDTN